MQSRLSLRAKPDRRELNPANERLKHSYFQFCREAGQLGEHSLDQIANAITLFEQHSKYRSFRQFRVEQAIAFKKYLATKTTARGDRPLSKASVSTTLHALRDFFEWLSAQRGFVNRLRRTDADYFKPSRMVEAISRAPRQALVPSLAQVRAMLDALPNSTSIERRNRALIAITILTGARDAATASLCLKHLDLTDRQLYQDARDVKTKFRKTFPTWFFPVDEEFFDALAEWKKELENVHRFGPDEPLFPKTDTSFGPKGEILTPGLKKDFWADAEPIRKVFKHACQLAELPSFKPHSFRHTLVQLAYSYCVTPGDFKAWSQNLGHEGVLVTLTSYGTLPSFTQRDLIKKIGERLKQEKS